MIPKTKMQIALCRERQLLSILHNKSILGPTHQAYKTGSSCKMLNVLLIQATNSGKKCSAKDNDYQNVKINSILWVNEEAMLLSPFHT